MHCQILKLASSRRTIVTGGVTACQALCSICRQYMCGVWMGGRVLPWLLAFIFTDNWLPVSTTCAFYHLASCNAIISLIGFSTIPVSLGPLSSRPHCPPHHFHTYLRRHQNSTTGSLSKCIQETCLRRTLMVSFTMP